MKALMRTVLAVAAVLLAVGLVGDAPQAKATDGVLRFNDGARFVGRDAFGRRVFVQDGRRFVRGGRAFVRRPAFIGGRRAFIGRRSFFRGPRFFGRRSFIGGGFGFNRPLLQLNF